MNYWKLRESIRDKRVFLSGPMTGIEHNNACEFARAHAMCKEIGAYTVWDPVIEWLMESQSDGSHEHYMRRALKELTGNHYNVILMLPGWADSEGAKTERIVAEACGIEVVEL